MPVIIIVQFDHLNREVMMNNSPIRFKVGGSARLARLIRNQEVIISGKIICIPRVKIRVRV